MATMLNPNAIPDGSKTQEKSDSSVLAAKQNTLTAGENITIVGNVISSSVSEVVDRIVNAGYVFAGVATPSTDPGTPEAKVFYIANGKGTYTNFGGLGVTEDEVVVLYYDTAWHKVSTGIASQEKLTELDEDINGKEYPYIFKTEKTFEKGKFSQSTVPFNLESGTYKIEMLGYNDVLVSDKYIIIKFKYEDDTDTGNITFAPWVKDSYVLTKNVIGINWYYVEGGASNVANNGIISVICTNLNPKPASEGLKDSVQNLSTSFNGFKESTETNVVSIIKDIDSLRNTEEILYDEVYGYEKVEETIFFRKEYNGKQTYDGSKQGIPVIAKNTNLVATVNTTDAPVYCRLIGDNDSIISTLTLNNNTPSKYTVAENVSAVSVYYGGTNSSWELVIKKDAEPVIIKKQGLVEKVDKLISAGTGNARGIIGSIYSDIIKQTRPYYFESVTLESDGMVTYGEGFLDKALNNTPAGKHFLVFTDIHLDYGQFGYYQKQSQIMRYIYEKLGGCKVVFLGDFIGQTQDTQKAIDIVKWFSNDYFRYFGGDYIPVIGNHDTDVVNGGFTAEESPLTTTFMADNFVGGVYKYGNAVQDAIAMSVIEGLTSISEEEKKVIKDYMKLHYYIDDATSKIRFITYDCYDVQFAGIETTFQRNAVCLPFILNAMATAPNDYDVVILNHSTLFPKDTFGANPSWERQLYYAISAFNNKGVHNMTEPSSIPAFFRWHVWPNLVAKYGTVYDFANKKGRCFTMVGHYHYDMPRYVNAEENAIKDAYTTIPNSGDVLNIMVDRSIMADGGSGLTGHFFSNSRKAEMCASATSPGTFIGTTDEVLFDIVTITEDNEVVLTRCGASPTVGVPLKYPYFDETTSYSIGDIVIHYETYQYDGRSVSNYRLYKFITQHSGAWNDSDVELMVDNEPYVRRFKL